MSTTESWRNAPPTPDPDELRQRMPPHSWIPGWLRAWWPALLWAAAIFVLSTDSFSAARTGRFFEPLLHWLVPSLTGAQFEVVHHFIRKSAHFIEYFIFFVLLYRGIRGSRRGWHWSSARIAWLIAAGYSAVDEIHQVWVPSRGPSAFDSMIDSTGALIALLFLFFVYRRLLRPRPA